MDRRYSQYLEWAGYGKAPVPVVDDGPLSGIRRPNMSLWPVTAFSKRT
jgi:hypothetical protein